LFVLILNRPFFPFLNLTGVYICMGIGADDVFVFLAAYDEAFRERAAAKAPTELDGRFMAAVLRDAGTATLVTSLTTAGAFFASAGSSIPSIACFGVYCGLVVLCDWLLMVMYVPALAAIYTKYVRDGCGGSRCEWCPHTPLKGTDPEQRRLKASLGQLVRRGLLPLLSGRTSAALLVCAGLGLGLGLGAQYVDPGFVYPSSAEMQLLRSSSPLEQYCCTGAKAKFQFVQDAGDEEDAFYGVTLVFGSEMVDNGDTCAHRTNPD
jgi:protein dispatched 1